MTPAHDDGAELVELYVPAKERPGVARDLLAAARELGADVRAVASTSDGYVVPLAVARAADLVEPAEPAELGEQPADGAGDDETEPDSKPRRGARKGGSK